MLAAAHTLLLMLLMPYAADIDAAADFAAAVSRLMPIIFRHDAAFITPCCDAATLMLI